MTPWTAAHQASLSLNISWSLLKLMSFELEKLSNYLVLCRPFLLLPSIFPRTKVFSNESALHIRWPKYWSFNFSINSFQLPMNIQDWFPLGLIDLISLQSKGLSRVFSNSTIWSYGSQPCVTPWSYEACRARPPETDGSWWRVLTKRGPLEKGMANRFSMLVLRTPWTVWKGKNK